MTQRKRTIMSDIADPSKNTKAAEGLGCLLFIGLVLIGTMWWRGSWPFGDNDAPDGATAQQEGQDDEFPNILGNTPTARPEGPQSAPQAEATSVYPLSVERCNEMYAAGEWNDTIESKCDKVFDGQSTQIAQDMEIAVAATVNAMSYATAKTQPVYIPPCTGCGILAHDGRWIITPVPPRPTPQPRVVYVPQPQPRQPQYVPPAGQQRSAVSPPSAGQVYRSTKNLWQRAIDITCGTFFSLDPRGYAGAGSLYGDPTRGCNR